MHSFSSDGLHQPELLSANLASARELAMVAKRSGAAYGRIGGKLGGGNRARRALSKTARVRVVNRRLARDAGTARVHDDDDEGCASAESSPHVQAKKASAVASAITKHMKLTPRRSEIVQLAAAAAYAVGHTDGSAREARRVARAARSSAAKPSGTRACRQCRRGLRSVAARSWACCGSRARQTARGSTPAAPSSSPWCRACRARRLTLPPTAAGSTSSQALHRGVAARPRR